MRVNADALLPGDFVAIDAVVIAKSGEVVTVQASGLFADHQFNISAGQVHEKLPGRMILPASDGRISKLKT